MIKSPPYTRRGIKMECALCKINGKNNKVYYEDDKIIIVECATCRVPLGILKRHTMQPSTEEDKELTRALISVAKRALGNKFRIDKKQRAIKDHLHYHARRDK